MRKTALMGLFVVLFSAVVTPAFAQKITDPKEYEAYMKTCFEEKDLPKKAAGCEKFLVDFKDTDARNQAYMMILLSHAQVANWTKTLEIADKQGTMAPALPVEDKNRTLLVGMTAAEQAKNTPKLKEYANKVLGVEPKNVGALVTLSGLLAAAQPPDLDQTLSITKRALAEPKPAAYTDAQWGPVTAQLRTTAAMVLLNQKKNADAIAEADAALKIKNNDATAGYAYYLKGLAMQPAMVDAVTKYQASMTELNSDKNRAADQLTRDDLKATAAGLLQTASAKTDELVDIFVSSVATGWPNAAAARSALKIFTGTPDELEKLIADKKAALGIK